MPAESRTEAAVRPFADTSNVQHSWPLVALDWRLTTPCSPMPLSFAPSTGCIVSARAAPPPRSNAPPTSTARKPIERMDPPWSLEDPASRRLIAAPFRGAYQSLKSRTAATVGTAYQGASRVQFLTATHPIAPELRRLGGESGEPMTGHAQTETNALFVAFLSDHRR